MTRALMVVLVLAVAGGCKTPADESAAPTVTSAPTPSGALAPEAAAAQAAGARTDRTTKAAVADPSGLSIAITVDGVPGSWPLKDIARVKSMEVEGDSGEGARNAWSLREVATALAGGARVVSLTDGDGKTVEIDAAGWTDAGKLPLLRVNRRGIVKFVWSSPTGEPLEGGDLRGVTKIDLVTK